MRTLTLCELTAIYWFLKRVKRYLRFTDLPIVF